ncbi:MAG: tetratricopeptide repeat protein, partial [Rhodospirillales bacterium]|nr:tetratricopeptide repeat protein [Rhodospirillales bacterium]
MLGLAVLLAAVSVFAAEGTENQAKDLVKQAHGKWRSGDLDGALTDLSKAIELEPQSADAHYARGKVKFDKGDLEGARLDREKALTLNPEKEYAPYAKQQPIWIVLVFIGLIFVTVSVLVVEIGLAYFSWRLSEGRVGNEAWGIEPDDLRMLPLSCLHAGDIREAERLRRFALRYGVAATAVAVVQYLLILQSSVIRGSLPTLLFCTSVPVGLIIATVACYRRGEALRQSARRLTITDRKVTFTEPTPLGEEEWIEPLEAFEGVSGRIETRGSGDDTYSVFVVELAHPVEEKTLCLNEKAGLFEGSV